MGLLEAIYSFDGRSVSDLKDAVRRVSKSDDAAFLPELCSSEDRLHRVAATWAVKALLEAGQGDSLDLSKVFARLEVETEPDAVLHLLQSVQFAPAAAKAYLRAIERHADHKKTLIAVWALDATVRLALAKSEGLETARQRVEVALSHEKASMRARARQLAPLLGL